MSITHLQGFGTYFGSCSADFGPRLPTNQLNNNPNLPLSVSSAYLLANLGWDGTSQIKVNPTQVRQEMGHPV